MDYFNTSPEDKLDKYLEYNPDFPIYRANNVPVETPEIIDYISNNLDNKTNNLLLNTKKYKTEDKVSVPVTNTKSTEKIGTDRLNELYKMGSNLEIPYSTANYPNKTYSSKYLPLLKRQLAAVESDGNGGYNALNPHSSAVGKYQFLWNTWKDSIGNVTGIKSKEEFRKNPEAQEKFFDFYAHNTLEPQLAVIKSEFGNTKMDDLDIMKALHFRGLGKKDNSSGLRQILSSGLKNTKLESYNMALSPYLKRTNSVK